MIAQLIVHIALGTAVATAAGYWIAALRNNEAIGDFARALYYLLTLMLIVTSGILLHAIVTHNFDFTYVQSYSSRGLQPPFLFAAFYSGQEGSFLLWALLTALVGVALIEYTKRHGIEAETMAFYTSVLVFLCIMLVAKNPFTYLWESFAREGTTRELIEALKSDPVRYNGRGLNPVLQNYWVMIHPPMLFSGFAAMTAPFALAMAGLLKRRYHEWTRLAQPWILLAVTVLGIGITLGGLWAYETLGWGGFWAWDPVENSSLVPWLCAVGLMHTTIIQRRTQGLLRTNFLLVTAAFATVLYSTFLTRSGVLGDTSVHSFVEPGYFVYLLLLIFLGSFVVLGVGMLLWRWRDITSAGRRHGLFALRSREFVLSVGVLCIIFSSAVVILGTSYPLVAELLGKPKAAIEPWFYNTVHLPLIALVLALNGISLIATWSQTNPTLVLRDTAVGFAIAGVLTAAAVAFSVVRTWTAAVVIATALFALLINMRHIVRLIRARKAIALGTYIAHAGLALLVLGILQLSTHQREHHLQLKQGEAVSALGYTFTLIDSHPTAERAAEGEAYRFRVAVVRDGDTAYAYPLVYWSDFNQRQAPFFEPGIIRHLGYDVYIAPKALDVAESMPTVTLIRGTPQPVPADSTWSIELIAFDMSQAQNQAGKRPPNVSPAALKLGTRIRVRSMSGATVDTTLYTYFDGRTFVPEPVTIAGTQLQLLLKRIERNQAQPELSTATIAVAHGSQTAAPPKQILIVDAAVKPYINLVWCGFLVILAGVGLSTFRSFRTTSLRPAAAVAGASPHSYDARPAARADVVSK